MLLFGPYGYSRADITSLVVDAAELAETDWEIEFVSDIRSKLDDPLWMPTQRQLDKLLEIACVS